MEGPWEDPWEGPWEGPREGPREGVATKDIHTVNTPSGGGIICVVQYSELLTKNTPPPNIRNVNIIIIPRMKGDIITLNKNEFLVYNYFAWTVVVSSMYNYLFGIFYLRVL